MTAFEDVDLFTDTGPDVRPGRHRLEDHATSVAGAGSVAYRAGTQKARLLAVYAAHARTSAWWIGITDDEAADLAGLLRSCFWKRCGELRQDGLIGPTGPTRPGHAGVSRITCRITDAGRNALYGVTG